MGRDKARLSLRGRPLALRVASTLQRVVAEVVLVGRDDVEERFPGFPSLRDRFPGAGPLAGLDAALLHAARGEAEARAVYLAACDLPGLSWELVRHIVAGAGDERLDPSPRAWVPRFEKRAQPLAALYSPGCGPVVEALLQRGERTVHRFLDQISVTAIPVTPELPFYRPDLLANLNRPRDLERFGPSWLG